MCEPTVLFAIGAAITAVSTAVSSVAASNQAKFDSAVAERNARLAERDARQVVEQSVADEIRTRIQTAQAIGRQRAQIAASGVALGGGDLDLSSDLIIEDTAASGEWDALAIRLRGSEEAKRFILQAADYRMRADQAKAAGKYNVASTIIGGVGSIALSSADFAMEGGFNPSKTVPSNQFSFEGLEVTTPELTIPGESFPGELKLGVPELPKLRFN